MNRYIIDEILMKTLRKPFKNPMTENPMKLEPHENPYENPMETLWKLYKNPMRILWNTLWKSYENPMKTLVRKPNEIAYETLWKYVPCENPIKTLKNSVLKSS